MANVVEDNDRAEAIETELNNAQNNVNESKNENNMADENQNAEENMKVATKPTQSH